MPPTTTKTKAAASMRSCGPDYSFDERVAAIALLLAEAKEWELPHGALTRIGESCCM